MAEENWHQARLIPTSGISGAEEQERRATSALLAVMSSVREFGRSITQPLGAPAGTVDTYIEVPFVFGDKRLYPDGLIRVSRGQRQWTALVEVAEDAAYVRGASLIADHPSVGKDGPQSGLPLRGEEVGLHYAEPPRPSR
jgi:hypothetical protein